MSPWARPNRRKAAPMEVTKCLENLFIIFALASLRFASLRCSYDGCILSEGKLRVRYDRHESSLVR
jgi:hypothetical protein